MLKGYFVQYKFYLPSTTKHSSYSYQKLFRAIYGYTQCVNKSSGKTYKYHRPGVLSFSPFIRPGKNSVIIPEEDLPKLLDFFKTGSNPTHKWQKKGDWKVTYFMNEKKINPEVAVKSIEQLLQRVFISKANSKINIFDEFKAITDNIEKTDKTHLSAVLLEAKKIVSKPWFNETYRFSPKLKDFRNLYLQALNYKKQ